VIAIDEFQEVVRIDPALPGVLRSELETHQTAAAYVFSGSHPGLMRELFSDRRHAFFAQATPITLGPLPPGRARRVHRRALRGGPPAPSVGGRDGRNGAS
jgi:hypothetical protein